MVARVEGDLRQEHGKRRHHGRQQPVGRRVLAPCHQQDGEEHALGDAQKKEDCDASGRFHGTPASGGPAEPASPCFADFPLRDRLRATGDS